MTAPTIDEMITCAHCLIEDFKEDRHLCAEFGDDPERLDHRIACMEAIVRELEKLRDAKETSGDEL